MTAEQIRRAHAQTPFKPFSVFLSDQRHFPVAHPEYLWLIPGGRTIGIADDSGAVEIIDLVYVTSLRLEDSKAA